MSRSTVRFRRQRGRSGRAGGFTLIELLLVLVILGVLATLVVPRFTGTSQRARIVAADTAISNISTALKKFEIECGRFPTTEEGLQALVQQVGTLQGWKGPYLEKGAVPKDPWGNVFLYRCPGQHNTDFDLWSCGPDGQDGGGDDIDNWTQK